MIKPTPDEIVTILKKHSKWLCGNGGCRANLAGADLRGAYLSGANLCRANLDGAYLYGANLAGANLLGAYLDGSCLRRADLGGANLRRANLYGADLDGANLDGAYLSGANLYGANLQGANLDGSYLPAPTVVLLAQWNNLPNDLTAVLMRLDASGHPDGDKPFEQWVSGGPCPYTNCHVQRVANFTERKECWGLEVKPMGLYEIMDRILRLKCKGWG